jgi:hypothetical protein
MNLGVSYRYDMHVDPEEKENGTDVIDEYERKANKKRGKDKKKKNKGKAGDKPKQKKQTQKIDFD